MLVDATAPSRALPRGKSATSRADVPYRDDYRSTADSVDALFRSGRERVPSCSEIAETGRYIF